MNFIRPLVTSAFLLSCLTLTAQESWLIPVDDPLYREAEELFIAGGMVPPYEELPLTADELKSQLLTLVPVTEKNDKLMEIYDLVDTIKLAFGSIEPIVDFGLCGGYNSETGKFQSIPLDDDPDNGLFVHNFIPFYESAGVPSVLKTGFVLQFAGFSLRFQPELRESNYGLLEDEEYISLPEGFDQLDINNNTPPVGIVSYFSPNFEVRFGRNKLHSGPGVFSSLSLAKTMPFFDHLRLRFHFEDFSFSATYITLSALISDMESSFLDYQYSLDKTVDKDRIKNYINLNFIFRPWPWLSLSYTQTSLVGGRPLQIADFNPFLLLTTAFDNDSYVCPILFSTTIVPLGGLKVYAELLLYDTDPGAIALMGGLTLLSTPFFDAGPGRFRLDFEATYTDPYAYGGANDLKKMTSRLLYLDRGPSPSRYWVDYPLGFYLGPDCLDLHAVLSYGEAGSWEVQLEWQSTAKGEVDLYGYGDDSDYITQPATSAAPSGTPAWTHTAKASVYFEPIDNIFLTIWYRIRFIENRFDPQTRTNIIGDNFIFHYIGLSAVWKLF